MRILIDLLHPAHVHFFRNFISEMERRGHKILITARKKDVLLNLLKEYNLNYLCLSQISSGKLGLAKEFLTRTAKLYRIARKFRPDVLLGVMGPSISVVGKLLGRPCVIFYNNENAGITNWFAYPLATAVCTSSSYRDKVNGHHITYPGYHELAYLHPQRYQPNKEVLKQLGIDQEKYVLVRFVSWNASHDIGEQGFQNKTAIVQQLERYAKVYITSESGVPEILTKNILRVQNKKDIFDVLNGATLYFGEGASMASEAAVLGVPAVYVNSLQLGFLQEQERDYGLVCNYTTEQPALQKALELLQRPQVKKEWQAKRKRLLHDKIDVTNWMVNFVEQRGWKKKK